MIEQFYTRITKRDINTLFRMADNLQKMIIRYGSLGVDSDFKFKSLTCERLRVIYFQIFDLLDVVHEDKINFTKLNND